MGLRSLNESELPHRISELGVKDIYAATGQDEINFSTFAFAVITYNRWWQYTSTFKAGAMNLDQFMAMIHDSLVPDYVRKSIDGIRINIPDDQLSWAMQKLIAGGGAGGQNFTVSPASQKEDEDAHQKEYIAKDFVVNFLQKKDDEASPQEKMNEKLKEAGLPTLWKHENKQRAIVYAIANTAANGALGFVQFYNVVKMAKIYDKNFVPGTGMPANNLAGTIDGFKGFCSPTE